jgi:hypothetical protein
MYKCYDIIKYCIDNQRRNEISLTGSQQLRPSGPVSPTQGSGCRWQLKDDAGEHPAMAKDIKYVEAIRPCRSELDTTLADRVHASLNNSHPGEPIYDPLLGSGREMTGRVCYGIELNPASVDVAVCRWQVFTGALRDTRPPASRSTSTPHDTTMPHRRQPWRDLPLSSMRRCARRSRT